jgi:hypothetical protein
MSTLRPVFRYFLAEGGTPLRADLPIWAKPLPISRKPSENDASQTSPRSVTYGHYFSAARRFLEFDDYAPLTNAIFLETGTEMAAEAIDATDIRLEKHGHFYHPAKVTLHTDAKKFYFILNVAFSIAGRDIIENEFALLKRLNDSFPFDFLPKVYQLGESYDADGLAMKCFLGQWLEGFHEFHLTRESLKNYPHIVLWDPQLGRRSLSHIQSFALIERAAMILTSYYNLVSAEMIFPWHHAAGDFVVRMDGDRIDVKLITVRGYTPLIGNERAKKDEPAGSRFLVDALTLFLVGLTIRMRIDRIDGVGDIVWYPPWALAATLSGFYQGLDLAVHMAGIPGEFIDQYKAYLNNLSDQNIIDAIAKISTTFHSQSAEVATISEHADSHAQDLRDLVKSKVGQEC